MTTKTAIKTTTPDLFAQTFGDDYQWDEHDLVTSLDRSHALANGSARGSRGWLDAHYAGLA